MKRATFAMCGYGPMLTNVMAILRKQVEFNCDEQMTKYQIKKKEQPLLGDC